MSNDAVQPADEISPELKQFKEWVVTIGDGLHNPFSDLVEPSQTSTDRNSEEKPSILHGVPDLFWFTYESKDHGFPASAWQFLAFMTQWFGLNVRSYLKYMQVNEELALGYYSMLHDKKDREYRDCTRFIEVLLINSCIVIFAIVLFQNVRNGVKILTGINENGRDPSYQRSRQFNILYQYIMRDPMGLKSSMLYMSHQIPWFVLEAVYAKHSNLSKLVGTPINILAMSCFDDLYPRVHKSKVHGGTITLPPSGFKHLLHMFHWTRTPEGKFLVDTRSLQPIKNMDSFYIPSATDLQLSATVFKKDVGGSNSVSYYDRRLSGVMQLAPLHIFNYSSALYVTLLEFEKFYIDCGFSISAYVACMATLLQTKADVKLVRANGIVPSTRKDEKEVLAFVQNFKEAVLSSDVCMPNDLNDLSEKVRAHNERVSSKSYAEFKSRYCGNTLITISVIAGIILFALTFIQTIYGTLSYYKQ